MFDERDEKSQQYKLIIFDWDGTLMDSVPRIVSCMQAAAHHSRVAVPCDQSVKAIIGLGLPEAIAELFPQATPDAHEQIRARYSHEYTSVDRSPSPLFDGVTDLLNDLSRAGCLMAVATGKSRIGLNRVMQGSGIEHHFSHSRCADETLSKPHPAMVEEILAVTSVPASQTLMVGDSPFDLEMAQRAGVDSIGVTYGAACRDELMKFSPIRCVDAVQELRFIL